MSNTVLIDIMDKNNHDAGTKARNDVTSILNSCGFETVVMFNRTHNNIVRTLEMVSAVMKIGSNVQENDLVVLQYPYQAKVMNLFLNRINEQRVKKKCKLVILIHDVHYMRNDSYINQSLEDTKKLEVGFFNAADAVIVHNDVMKKQLASDGVTTPMVSLGIFDYLYDGKSAEIVQDDKIRLVFAGNLSPEKSGFIYQYEPDERVAFNLYGTKPDSLSSSFDYKGSFPPDDLIENLVGNYGLVWDGPSADTCTGSFGNYLRYNDPHKLSLYLAAGLPVVVWNESAMTSFVTDAGIGKTISNLGQLVDLPGVNTEEYRTMRNQVLKYSASVSSGEYLVNAVKKVEEMMK